MIQNNNIREKALSTFLLDSSLTCQSTQGTSTLQLLHCRYVLFANTQRSALFAQNCCDKFCQICDFANSFSYLNKCYITQRDKRKLL